MLEKLPHEPARCRTGITRRLVFVLGTALIFASMPFAFARQESDEKKVRLIVDYADGMEKHFTRIAWKPGLTVLDTLETASKHRRGTKFKHTGSGATAFVAEIDDLKNEGGGTGKKNWIYLVNDKLGDRSCGVFELKADDKVVWRFGNYKVDK